ncbi:hypothetical protein, partial [Enterococcus cecorum]
LGAYTAGVAQAGDGSSQLAAGLQTMQGQLPDLANGINQLAEGSKQLADQLQAGTSQFGEEQATQLRSYVNGVQQYINTINAV